MGVKQDRYNRRKKEEAAQAVNRIKMAALQAQTAARDKAAAYAAAKKISDAANSDLANANAAAKASLAAAKLPFPQYPTYPPTVLTPQQKALLKTAEDAKKAADDANGETDASKKEADDAAEASYRADMELAEYEENMNRSSKISCGKTQFPEIQSVDPPVLIISILIFAVLISLCYFPFKLLFDSTIIQLFADTVISPNIQLTIYQRMLGSKFVLFLLVFLTLTLTILFGVYKLILGGSPEHYSSAYACISVCFFTTVFVTFLLLEFFPYLVNIFENTIGYLWICIRPKIGKVTFNMDEFNKLFDQNIVTLNDKYDVSYKFLITLMSLYNMDNVIKDFSQALDMSTSTEASDTEGSASSEASTEPTTDSTESTADSTEPTNKPTVAAVVASTAPTNTPNAASTEPTKKGGGTTNNKFFIKTPVSATIKKQIANLCFIKHSTGHFVWIYFASLICTFTSIKAFSKYLV